MCALDLPEDVAERWFAQKMFYAGTITEDETAVQDGEHQG